MVSFAINHFLTRDHNTVRRVGFSKRVRSAGRSPVFIAIAALQGSRILASLDNFRGNKPSLDREGQEAACVTTRSEQSEQKRAAVNAEIDRVNKLPANSIYATHRMRVLNKILQLISIQRRTLSQDEELELLFAGLSL